MPRSDVTWRENGRSGRGQSSGKKNSKIYLTLVLFFKFFLQAIMAEGKEHACAVGLTKLSTEDM